jgi:hypothetical protein
MKMSKPDTVGIDVSMLWLEVVVLPRGVRFSVTNAAAGWAELVQKLRP